MKSFILFGVILLVTKETTSKPFLYSTSKWFFQRLFSTNSSLDHSTKNIEDLSEEGPFFYHNEHANITLKNRTLQSNGINQKLNLQSQIVDLTYNNKPVKKENDGSLDNVNKFSNNQQNETNINESPGVLQRKISKILNKLQLYSAVKSTIHEVRKHQNGYDNKPQRIVKLSSNNQTMYLPVGEPFNSTETKHIDTLEEDNIDFDPEYDEPFVFDDDIDTDKRKMDENKLSLETGNIGIHIMEIFGSIATIFLSAAYQVGMYVNSFSGNNQGMVTSKPIEGTGTNLQWKIN